MKRFKKLLPIAGILVLVSALVVPTAVLADPLTAISVFQSNEAPGGIDDFFIEFTTATPLPPCLTPSVDYSQFNIDFAGNIGLLADSPTEYGLVVDAIPPGPPSSYLAGGGNPGMDGEYSLTIDNVDKIVSIKYFHQAPLDPGTIIEVLVMATNPADTGYLPIDIETRDLADLEVDTGRGYYLVRQPQELVATALAGEISVTLEDGTVYYGTVATGDIQNTALFDDPDNPNGMVTPATQIITNTGGVNLDYDIMSSNALEAGLGEDDWLLVPALSNLDEFTHAYSLSDTDYLGGPVGVPVFTNWTAPDAYDLGVATDVAPDSFTYLELEIGIPNDVTSYEAHQITVTVQVSAS